MITDTIITNTLGPGSAWFWASVQAVALIISLILIYRQLSVAHSTTMIETCERLESRFSCPQIKGARKDICDQYTNIQKRGVLVISVSDDLLSSFYEDLGLLYDRRIIDLEMIWERFSYECIDYWYILRPRIIEHRSAKKDSTLYDKFEKLVTDLRKIERKRISEHNLDRTEAQLLSFCNEQLQHLVAKISNQEPQPTPTAVMPPAAQTSRQP